MPGGIRPRLTRLTSPEMKRFVSDAVKVADDAAGKKLMAELNKQWATALKGFKQYEKLVAIAEKMVRDLAGKVDQLDFAEAQAMINYVNKELKPIAAAVTKFEQAEDALVAKYGKKGLRKVAAA